MGFQLHDLQRRFQISYPYGLADEIVHAGIKANLTNIGSSIGSNSNDMRLLSGRRMMTYVFCCFQSIHLWHPYIHENYIVVAVKGSQDLYSIGYHICAVPQLLQHQQYCFLVYSIVLGNQYRQFRTFTC